MASEYLSHRYAPIPATSKLEAVNKFYARYGYMPATVFGPDGCQDAPPSKFVPKGYYFCSKREEVSR